MECVICLAPKRNHPVTTLHCGHAYHEGCLSTSQRCAMCRRDFIPECRTRTRNDTARLEIRATNFRDGLLSLATGHDEFATRDNYMRLLWANRDLLNELGGMDFFKALIAHRSFDGVEFRDRFLGL